MQTLFDAVTLTGSGLSGFDKPISASSGPALIAATADDDHDDDGSLRKRYRTIFISDLHLGTPGCQADALLDFLKVHPSDNLFLVGDIVDGWQLRRKWYWPQSHNDVVQKLLRRARKGCATRRSINMSTLPTGSRKTSRAVSRNAAASANPAMPANL